MKISWLEKKNEDWIVASLERESGDTLNEVSINRKSKKGELFPNFDGLMAGSDVEGELWQSSGGKWYLFPPRSPQKAQGGAYKQKLMEEAVARKETFITKTVASKEESIKLSSAQRDAVLMVTTFHKDQFMKIPHDRVVSQRDYYLDEEAVKSKITEWRDWFLLSKEFNDTPPF